MVGQDLYTKPMYNSKKRRESTIPKITDKDVEGMTYKEKQQFYKYRSTLGVARKSTHTFREVAKI